MRKSKHFRKDVIIARVIFAALCIALIVLISTVFNALFGKDDQGDKPNLPGTENSQDEQNDDLGDINSEGDTTDTEDSEQIQIQVVRYAQTTAQLRLREEPNTNCDTLITVEKGQRAVILEDLDGWYRVSYNGVVGYFAAKYVEVIEVEEEVIVQ